MVLIASVGLAIVATTAVILTRDGIPFGTLSMPGDGDNAHALSAPLRLPLPIDLVVESAVLRSGEKADGKRVPGRPSRLIVDDASIVLTLPQGKDRATPAMSTPADVGPQDVIADLAPLLAALSRLEFNNLTLRRGTIRIAGQSGANRVLSDVHVMVAVEPNVSLAVTGSLQQAGRSLKIEATLGLARDKSTNPGMPLRLLVKGVGLDIAINGRLSFDGEFLLDGVAEVTASKVRKLATLVGLGLPADLWPRNLKINGNLRWSPRTVALDRATFTADGNVATGALSVIVSNDRPAVVGTLAFDRLELQQVALVVLSGPAQVKGGSAQAIDVSLPILRDLDADLRLSASDFSVGKMPFGRAAVSVALKAGRLLADIAEIEIATGQATGQISIDVTQPKMRVTVRGKADNANIASLIGEERSRTSLDGRANIVLDTHASGSTVAELLGSLGGKVAILMPSGGRIGFDGRAAVAMAQQQDIFGWTAPLRTSTMFDQLEVRLVGNDGWLKVETAKVKLADTLLLGDGSFDIKSQLLDLRLISNNTEKPKGAGDGAGNVYSGGSAASVAGPWWSPAIRALRRLARPMTDSGPVGAGAEGGPGSAAFVIRDPG